MSRTGRFLSGMGFGYTTQILTMIIGFWLVPFLLFRIGQHDYGLWLVGTQIMFYLGLLDLGIIAIDRKSTRLNSSHRTISYAVFCLKKKKNTYRNPQLYFITPRSLILLLPPKL